MEWVALIAFGVSLVASYYLRPKLETPLAAKAEDAKFPRCEEGALIPIVFGTVQINRPQLLWIRQLPTTPVMDFAGSTTGYAYHAAMTLGLCRGKIDCMVGLVVDGHPTSGLDYINVEDATYPIKKHFATVTRYERGYEYILKGYCTFGDATPGYNVSTGFPGVAYLINPSTGTRDGLAPGNFGVAVMEFDSIYLGQSPYPKEITARVQRINYGLDGVSAQWYAHKAAIPIGRQWAEDWSYLLTPSTDATAYQDPNYSVATWDFGPGAVGNTLMPAGVPVVNQYVADPVAGDKLWLRTDLGAIEASVLGLHIWHANTGTGETVQAWLNGVALTLHTISTTEKYAYLQSDLNRSGSNILAVKVTFGTSPTIAYAGVSALARDAAIEVEDAGVFEENMVAMNPTHMIREVLLDAQDGMGYLAADVEDTAFEAVADTLYNERFGLCLQWEKSVTAGEFIEEILRYINGRIYVNRTTGKFTLRLIRQDYTVGDLLVLDDDNTVAVEELSRRATGDLINAVRIEYTNSLSGDQGTVTVHDPALIQTQGQLYSSTVKYPGITEFGLASRVGLRDLQIASRPLWVCKVTANREAADLYMGDPVVLNKPSLGIDSMVMRVTAIDIGNGIDNRVVMSLIEDAFTSPIYSTVSRSNTRWINPNVDAPPASTVLVYDMPYYDLRQLMGETAVEAFIDPTLATDVGPANNGYVKIAAVQPTGALNATAYSRAGSADFALVGAMNFCPSCQLAAEVLISATTISYVNDINFGSVVAGNLAILGTTAAGVREVIRIDAINLDTKVLTVSRGCLDTVPVAHPVEGTILMYTGSFTATDTTPRGVTDIVGVKVCPRNSRGEAPIAEATEFQLSLDERYSEGDQRHRRAFRNYPPSFFRMNGYQFPEILPATGNLVFTWCRRSKYEPYVREYTSGSYTGTADVWDPKLSIIDDRGYTIKTSTMSAATETFTYTNTDETTDRNSASYVDASFSSVSCLLHMDGPNGYKTIVDHGPSQLTFSPLGTAEISTTQSKFGGASLSPGTLGATTWTTTPFQFGSGNFTIEAWVYLSSTPSTNATIASYKDGNFNSGKEAWWFCVDSSRNLRFYWSENGSSITQNIIYSAGKAMTTGEWHYVSVIKTGTSLRLWVDGTDREGSLIWTTGEAGQSAAFSGSIYAATAPVSVGTAESDYPFPGYIDELRITKGVARSPWYSVPSIPWPQGSVGLSTSLRVLLGSVCQLGDDPDIESTYFHDWTIYRFGYGAGYGKSYGGTP